MLRRAATSVRARAARRDVHGRDGSARARNGAAGARNGAAARSRRDVSTLILLRHGQSIWNGTTATFTGWVDVPLTERGRSQAREAGELLLERGFGDKITKVFTSELSRAWETASLAIAGVSDGPEIVRDARLNERHYGCVQGVCKRDATLLRYFGEDNVKSWRRSMHGRPPPLDESHPHWRAPPAPTTESLADCQERVLECYEERVLPALFEKPAATVLVAAHSNTLRALMAHVDGVPDDAVPSLHVPNSVPILYRFDEATRTLASRALSVDGAAGSHARWLLSSRNLQRLKSAVAPGGLLTRALFDALDADGDRSLTVAEIERGVRRLLKDDVVVAGVVKNIVRRLDLKDDGTCTMEDFERSAAEFADDMFREADVLAERAARTRREVNPDTPWGRVQSFG
mmetsp:Transcript_23194/g.69750  ORF Transcript_23194/g.69750 Transcript_23194/m.69750 type:complete len:403 (+) Transcript_23194:226-1434(+)